MKEPETDFEISIYQFDSEISEGNVALDFKQEWPVVYILNNEEKKMLYVGETAHVKKRMHDHINNPSKSKFTGVRFISSRLFNKSATLDIEANLIQYLAADNKFELLNGNLGTRHGYYQKEKVYWPIFKCIWNRLRSEGIAEKSLEYLTDTDLFKYSPYKSLTGDQMKIVDEILNYLLDDGVKSIIAEGSAGTGKTIIAIYLFKLLMTYQDRFEFETESDFERSLFSKVKSVREKYTELRIALVIPMSSFRKTMKTVFKETRGLKGNMVIGPAELSRNKYDIVIVDESHRLRRAVNLGTYTKAFRNAAKRLELDEIENNELDFALKQSTKLILFYDEFQSVRPGDVRKEDFERLKEEESTTIMRLRTQFRVKGGNGYLRHVNYILSNSLEKESIYKHSDYELMLFESLEEMIQKN